MKLLFKILQQIVIGLLTVPAMVLNVVVMVVSMTVGMFIAIPIITALGIDDGIDKYMDCVVLHLFPSGWLSEWGKWVNKQ